MKIDWVPQHPICLRKWKLPFVSLERNSAVTIISYCCPGKIVYLFPSWPLIVCSYNGVLPFYLPFSPFSWAWLRTNGLHPVSCTQSLKAKCNNCYSKKHIKTSSHWKNRCGGIFFCLIAREIIKFFLWNHQWFLSSLSLHTPELRHICLLLLSLVFWSLLQLLMSQWLSLSLSPVCVISPFLFHFWQ